MSKTFEQRYKDLKKDIHNSLINVKYPKKHWSIDSSDEVYLVEGGENQNIIKDLFNKHNVKSNSTLPGGRLWFEQDEEGKQPNMNIGWGGEYYKNRDGKVIHQDKLFYLMENTNWYHYWGTRDYKEGRKYLIKRDEFPCYDDIKPEGTRQVAKGRWENNNNPTYREILEKIGITNPDYVSYEWPSPRTVGNYLDTPVEAYAICNREAVFIIKTARLVKGVRVVNGMGTYGQRLKEINLSTAFKEMKRLKKVKGSYEEDKERIKEIRQKALAQAL